MASRLKWFWKMGFPFVALMCLTNCIAPGRGANALAAKVRAAYRDAPSLYVDTELSAVGMDDELRNVMAMTPEAMRSQVFVNKKLCVEVVLMPGILCEYRYGAQQDSLTQYEALVQGKDVIKEKCRVTPSREHPGHFDTVLCYKPPYPHGTPELRFDKDVEKYSCLFGSRMKTWVGQSGALANICSIIGDGMIDRYESFGDYDCVVVRTKREYEDGYRRWDDFWIDKASGFIVRWDTLTSDDGAVPHFERGRRSIVVTPIVPKSLLPDRQAPGSVSMTGISRP